MQTRKPSPGLPNTFSFGTFMPSNTNSPVGAHFRPSLVSIGRALQPFIFFGSMMNAVMPLLPFSRSV